MSTRRKGKAGSTAPLVLLSLLAIAGAGLGVWLIAGNQKPVQPADHTGDIALQTDAETGLQTTLTEAVSTTATTNAASGTAAAETTVTLSPDSVTGITLSFYKTTMRIGDDPVMPWVTMTPESAKDKSEIWKSSDESVATVDNIGRITPVKAGSCTVTVTSANNPAVKAEVSVTVTSAAENAVPASTTAASTTASSAAASTTAASAATTAASGARDDIEVIDGVTYVQGVLIANKTYPLPASYNPGCILPEAQAAFDKMAADAAAEGLSFTIVSGFRSYDFQKQLYTNYCNRDGKEAADRYSARAGHSEHQTGLAMDINCAGSAFNDTPEAKWIAANCWKYGFILRYPKDKEDVTGYMYESWHVRYLGEEWAKKIYDSGLTLEEYFNIDSKYAE